MNGSKDQRVGGRRALSEMQQYYDNHNPTEDNLERRMIYLREAQSNHYARFGGPGFDGSQKKDELRREAPSFDRSPQLDPKENTLNKQKRLGEEDKNTSGRQGDFSTRKGFGDVSNTVGLRGQQREPKISEFGGFETTPNEQRQKQQETKQLKEQNDRLREEISMIQEKLNAVTIQGQRQYDVQSKQNNHDQSLRFEMENSQKRIDQLSKENKKLQAMVLEGNQSDKVFKMENELKLKDLEVKTMKKELEFLRRGMKTPIQNEEENRRKDDQIEKQALRSQIKELNEKVAKYEDKLRVSSNQDLARQQANEIQELKAQVNYLTSENKQLKQDLSSRQHLNDQNYEKDNQQELGLSQYRADQQNLRKSRPTSVTNSRRIGGAEQNGQAQQNQARVQEKDQPKYGGQTITNPQAANPVVPPKNEGQNMIRRQSRTIGDPTIDNQAQINNNPTQNTQNAYGTLQPQTRLVESRGNRSTSNPRNNIQNGYSLNSQRKSFSNNLENPEGDQKQQLAAMKDNQANQIPRDIQIGVQGPHDLPFTDRITLKQNYNNRIIFVTVSHDESGVNGIGCHYYSPATDKITKGTLNGSLNNPSSVVEEFNIWQSNKLDYLKYVQGVMNVKQNQILNITFVSAKGYSKTLGYQGPASKKGVEGLKHFIMDIHEFEKPICLFGSFSVTEGTESQKKLTSVGFNLLRDEGMIEEILPSSATQQNEGLQKKEEIPQKNIIPAEKKQDVLQNNYRDNNNQSPKQIIRNEDPNNQISQKQQAVLQSKDQNLQQNQKQNPSDQQLLSSQKQQQQQTLLSDQQKLKQSQEQQKIQQLQDQQKQQQQLEQQKLQQQQDQQKLLQEQQRVKQQEEQQQQKLKQKEEEQKLQQQQLQQQKQLQQQQQQQQHLQQQQQQQQLDKKIDQQSLQTQPQQQYQSQPQQQQQQQLSQNQPSNSQSQQLKLQSSSQQPLQQQSARQANVEQQQQSPSIPSQQMTKQTKANEQPILDSQLKQQQQTLPPQQQQSQQLQQPTKQGDLVAQEQALKQQQLQQQQPNKDKRFEDQPIQKQISSTDVNKAQNPINQSYKINQQPTDLNSKTEQKPEQQNTQNNTKRTDKSYDFENPQSQKNQGNKEEIIQSQVKNSQKQSVIPENKDVNTENNQMNRQNNNQDEENKNAPAQNDYWSQPFSTGLDKSKPVRISQQPQNELRQSQQLVSNQQGEQKYTQNNGASPHINGTSPSNLRPENISSEPKRENNIRSSVQQQKDRSEFSQSPLQNQKQNMNSPNENEFLEENHKRIDQQKKQNDLRTSQIQENPANKSEEPYFRSPNQNRTSVDFAGSSQNNPLKQNRTSSEFNNAPPQQQNPNKNTVNSQYNQIDQRNDNPSIRQSRNEGPSTYGSKQGEANDLQRITIEAKPKNIVNQSQALPTNEVHPNEGLNQNKASGQGKLLEEDRKQYPSTMEVKPQVKNQAASNDNSNKMYQTVDNDHLHEHSGMSKPIHLENLDTPNFDHESKNRASVESNFSKNPQQSNQNRSSVDSHVTMGLQRGKGQAENNQSYQHPYLSEQNGLSSNQQQSRNIDPKEQQQNQRNGNEQSQVKRSVPEKTWVSITPQAPNESVPNQERQASNIQRRSIVMSSNNNNQNNGPDQRSFSKSPEQSERKKIDNNQIFEQSPDISKSRMHANADQGYKASRQFQSPEINNERRSNVNLDRRSQQAQPPLDFASKLPFENNRSPPRIGDRNNSIEQPQENKFRRGESPSWIDIGRFSNKKEGKINYRSDSIGHSPTNPAQQSAYLRSTRKNEGQEPVRVSLIPEAHDEIDNDLKQSPFRKNDPFDPTIAQKPYQKSESKLYQQALQNQKRSINQDN